MAKYLVAGSVWNSAGNLMRSDVVVLARYEDKIFYREIAYYNGFDRGDCDCDPRKGFPSVMSAPASTFLKLHDFKHTNLYHPCMRYIAESMHDDGFLEKLVFGGSDIVHRTNRGGERSHVYNNSECNKRTHVSTQY